MRRLVLLLLCVGPMTAHAELPPSSQGVILFHARHAVREKRATEVLKLWLLRNSLLDQGGQVEQDAEVLSTLWVALGTLGLCQDGVPQDTQGAGLWPLAMHNAWVKSWRQGAPSELPAPFESFEQGQQQRQVSLHDVLSAEELRSVSFPRMACSWRIRRTWESRVSLNLSLEDRLLAALWMQHLLKSALQTLVRDKVESTAAVEARLFALELALLDLQERAAKKTQRAQDLQSTRMGLSKQKGPEVSAPLQEEQTRFLQKTLTWEVRNWLTLRRAHRLFLFSKAAPLAKDRGMHDRLVLAMIDALLARREGEEVEAWIGFLGSDPLARSLLTEGERGQRLLTLDPRAGFRERAPVALHRGMAFLAEGKRQEALQSFAYALAHAGESRASDATAGLARRWLGYVLARFEVDDELLATLTALVPRQEYNAVVEGLLWRAAFHADASSLARLFATVRPGTALDRRVPRLRLLAQGKREEFLASLREGLSTEPQATLRFVQQLLDRLEAEDAEIRKAQLPLLQSLVQCLETLTGVPGGRRTGSVRTAEACMVRVRALLEGLQVLDSSPAGKAHALSPEHELFAGNLRLAPVDPPPWPFRIPEVSPPDVFVPLQIEPVDGQRADGSPLFGWRVTE